MLYKNLIEKYYYIVLFYTRNKNENYDLIVHCRLYTFRGQ